MSEQEKSNAGPLAFGALAAVAVGVAVISFLPEADVAVPDADGAQVQADAPAAEPDVALEPEALVIADDPVPTPEEPEEDVAYASASTEEPEVETALPAPEFDTFRVEPDGSMVIAGRAMPNQMVDIMLAGDPIERVTADASGSFVAFPSAGPSDVPRRLSLLADPEGAAIGSETSFMVAPIAAPEIVAAVEAPVIAPEPELPEAAEVEAGPTAEDATAEVAQVDPAPAAEDTSEAEETEVAALPEPSAPDTETAPAEPAAPTVLQADSRGIRVVQSAPSLTAPIVENVALDAITYDPAGDVQLSGRATGSGSVQIYLDNQPVTTSPVSPQGDFRIDLPEVDTGVYTLRIDEVDDEGDVVSRIETPFKREEAEDVAAVLAAETSQDGFEVAVKTVQPGATLWAIAEENLGNGIYYVEVFEANSDLIRDPDLIYPGQIFRIPEVTE